MIRFPFVSRDRYEESQRRVADLEAERRQLIDRILGLSGGTAVYEKKQASPALTSFLTTTQGPKIEASNAPQEVPAPRRISPREMVHRAQKDARNRAATGSSSVAAELKQAAETNS